MSNFRRDNSTTYNNIQSIVKITLVYASRNIRESINIFLAYILLLVFIFCFSIVNTTQRMRETTIGKSISTYFNYFGIRQEWSMFSGNQNLSFDTMHIFIKDKKNKIIDYPIRNISFRISLSKLIFQSGNFSNRSDFIIPLKKFFCALRSNSSSGYIEIKNYHKNKETTSKVINFNCYDN
jgi:hypothetical protein